MKRFSTRCVKIGDIEIGATSSLKIQSMCKTSTQDVCETVDQIIDLYNSSCDIVRIALQNKKDILSIKKIKETLLKKNINIPIVADIHFYPKAAIEIIDFVDKVRINPGNFLNKEYFFCLIEKCKKLKKPVRIGVNQGSLSKDILKRCKNIPCAMVESLFEYLDICFKKKFFDVVVSLKSSNVRTMIDSHLLMVDKMKKKGYNFPIHLGVTEAGEGIDARVKSTIGIGYLLSCGIGDTIRVSLTENPKMEVIFAKKLLKEVKDKSILKRKYLKKDFLKEIFHFKKKDETILCLKDIDTSDKIYVEGLKDLKEKKVSKKSIIILKNFKEGFKEAFKIKKWLTEKKMDLLLILSFEYKNMTLASLEIGILFLEKIIDGISFKNDANKYLLYSILENTNDINIKTKYISCPGCSRTTFNIQKVVKEIKEMKISKSKKIAVMGCIVNGPGEMKGADFGIVGRSKNRVDIYEKSKILFKDIDIEKGKKILFKMLGKK